MEHLLHTCRPHTWAAMVSVTHTAWPCLTRRIASGLWTHFLSLKALSAFFCTLCLPRAAGNLLGYFKYVFLIDSSHWVRNGPCVVKTGPKQPESKRAHRNPLAQAQPWGVLPTSDFQWGTPLPAWQRQGPLCSRLEWKCAEAGRACRSCV